MADGAQLHAVAVAELRRGRPLDAERALRRLLTEAEAPDERIDAWLDDLVRALDALGRRRAAAHTLVYLGRFAEARATFAAEGARADAARTLELWAGRPDVRQPVGATVEEMFATAGREYESVGLRVHAALAWRRAGAHGEARRAFEEVLRDGRLAARPYERALTHFNVGLSARAAVERPAAAPPASDRARTPDAAAAAADRHLVRAQQLLEEVADRFESDGERDRAFYCYSVLIHLGREEGWFENLAEGYLNCIRILKEDNLRYYVLQYYEDFLRLAVERGELHAAALGYREAADYARRAGLAWDRSYLQRSAETWWLAAEKNERDGGPVELSENAYLAAVDGFAALGDFHRVRESYRKLAALGLPEPRRERYRRVAARYPEQGPRAVDVPALPEYLRRAHAYPRAWEADLVEWELDGDPAATCAAMVGDARQAGRRRRVALEIVLLCLDGEREPISPGADAARRARIAERLGDLWHYPALSPLERLLLDERPAVRLGVMRAIRSLDFKRTFQLLRAGLRDPAPEVRDAAVEALEALHFPHLFEPLVRVFREQPQLSIRATALVAIGRIRNLEAMEFLLEVLRHENDALRETARQQLAQFDSHQLAPLVRRHLEVESGPARAALEQVLRASGG
jgi:hypothetical protein